MATKKRLKKQIKKSKKKGVIEQVAATIEQEILSKVSCDNDTCGHHVKGRCTAQTLALTKTWVGHMTFYRLVCISATDYIGKKY